MNNKWTIDLTGYILDAGTFNVCTAFQEAFEDSLGTDVMATIEMPDSKTVHIVFSIGDWVFAVPPRTLELLAQLARIKLRLDKEER